MNRKDLMILIIPLLIVSLLYLILPAQIPRHISFSGKVSYASKELIFIFGFIPFLVYKRRQGKK